METKVNYTLVGIFVISLTMAIILATLWLSAGLSIGEYSTYLVYMQESVSGLNPDSQVEYNGVSVGTVKSIELNQKNPQWVEVLLNIKKTTPITRGTVATLTTRGLTGLAFVALKDKSTDLRPLKALPGQRYPVIPSGPSIFMRLDALLSGLSKNFQAITTSLNNLLDKQNLESLKGILINLNDITKNLSNNNQTLNEILKNTKRASEQFTPLMRSSSSAMKTLEIETLPTVSHLLSNLDDILHTLNDVTLQLKQNPSMLIRGKEPLPPGPGESR